MIEPKLFSQGITSIQQGVKTLLKSCESLEDIEQAVNIAIKEIESMVNADERLVERRRELSKSDSK